MDIILCHTTADFDALGAAVGLTRLHPSAHIVLTGGCHPTVGEFLALYRDEYALIEQRAVNPEQIRSLLVVDTQRRDRLGKAAQWLDLPQLVEIAVYDHHLDIQMDIPVTRTLIEPVGATTTLIVEQLQAIQIQLNPAQATVMALGIHVDTGSLKFDHTTPRDATALAWLMQQGASLRAIADYVDPAQIPQQPTARDLMSSPVRTIRPETTIAEAQRILLRYRDSGLSIVDAQDQLVGMISRRDIDIALRHGFSHAPVKGYMITNLKTISPDTTLPDIQSLMVTYDIGRLPVLENGLLLGIVTRTDVLRELHHSTLNGSSHPLLPTLPGSSIKSKLRSTLFPSSSYSSLQLLRSRLAAPQWELLTRASEQAEQRGWHLYLVGGAVRDLLLSINSTESGTLMIEDIDLVVDGFHRGADVGAGVELARALQHLYPDAHLEIHGAFQTAALLWHKDQVLDSLWMDIATARTEFYPYPAANPEVEASSIRQDLYRRDFTINALAMRLTSPRAGELLDFFGGLLDLEAGLVRVLHANSFIEDPTRIYRAVRFAVRLGFYIDPQTEGYIHYAIASGIYDQTQGENSKAPALQTRLRSELKYILQAPYWKPALRLLAALGALKCIHPTLELDHKLWRQLRFLERCLRRFDPQDTGEPPIRPYTHWLLRLEVLIAHLSASERGKVATNLHLPVDSIERLLTLAQAQAEVMASLPMCQLPSQVVELLRRYDLPMLILIGVESPRSIRRQIWQYLTILAKVQPPLNGNDLKALGYKQGPQYRQILSQVLAATLDGVISDRASAQAFLAKNYPL